MRIVHIITSMNKGGAETTLFKILKFSKDKNIKDEHIVISFSESNYFETEIKNLNIGFHKINFKSKIFFFIYFFKLFKLLKELNPDTVQCWMYHALFLGGIASKIIKIKKIIWNIRHSNYEFNKTKLSTIIIIKICAYLSKKIPHEIIYCSDSSYNFHTKIGYYSLSKNIIYNGYDEKYFKKKSKIEKKNNDMIRFGFIGRYSPQKNISMYLKAFSLFLNKYQYRLNVKLLMYGKGIESTNNELLKQIKKNKLSSFVELKGYSDDVRIAIKNIDILGLCSSYGESFPNVLAEAMISGVPCISTQIGEANNILSNYGKIVSLNDTVGFSNAINEYYNLIKHNEEYDKLSNLCRIHIKKNYSIEKMFNKYENLWHK